MLNINSEVLSPVYAVQLVMDHVVAVVPDFEVVHLVRMFVVDQSHQPKVLIPMKIVLHLSYVEHHEVHINVRIHRVQMMNVQLVQPMSMLLILILNKSVQH
jgi:hypothetical protein